MLVLNPVHVTTCEVNYIYTECYSTCRARKTHSFKLSELLYTHFMRKLSCVFIIKFDRKSHIKCVIAYQICLTKHMIVARI